MLERRLERRRRRGRAEARRRPRDAARAAAAMEGVHVAQSIGRYIVDVVAATRDSAQRLRRRQPARQPRAAEALALPRRPRGPRLRHAGRREGGRGTGAGAPADAPARALGAAALRRGRRPRRARDGADAASRGRSGLGMTRSALAAAARLRGARGARPARRAGSATPRARGPGGAVRRARRRRAPAGAGARRAGRARAGAGPRASSATRCRWCVELSATDAASTGSSSCSSCRTASRSSEGDHPFAVTLSAGEDRDVALRLRCDHWGAYRARRHPAACARPPRSPHDRVAGRRARSRCASTRARSWCASSCARCARRSSRATRSPARRATGSSSPTRGSSYPATALRSINWRASARRGAARRQRVPPGAEHGRDPVPRQLRRGACAARREHARRRRAGHATLATQYLERRDRVGLVTFGGILRWLVPGHGASRSATGSSTRCWRPGSS